jgi:hypothetical protein
MSKCVLCDGHNSSGQKGGSLASDNVVSIVHCDTFKQMDGMFDNHLVGGSAPMDADMDEDFRVHNSDLEGGKRRMKKKKPTKKRVVRKQKGGSCGDEVVNDLPSMYSANTTNIPQAHPQANTGSMDMSRIAQYVMDNVANQTSVNDTAFNKVYFPEYISENVPSLQQMAGGKSGKRGGCPPCELVGALF